jgi:hypothetical protein
MEGLNAALDDLKGEGNDKLRAVFLKAEGQTFCAGGDLKVRSEPHIIYSTPLPSPLLLLLLPSLFLFTTCATV